MYINGKAEIEQRLIEQLINKHKKMSESSNSILLKKSSDFRKKGGVKLNQHICYIEIEDKELENIFKRLEEAKNEIYKCYDELRRLGVLKITPSVGADGVEENVAIELGPGALVSLNG